MGTEPNFEEKQDDNIPQAEHAENPEQVASETAPINHELLTEEELIVFEALAAEQNILRFQELLTSYNYHAGVLHSTRATEAELAEVNEVNSALAGHIEAIDTLIATAEAVDLTNVTQKVAQGHNKILEDLRENRRRAEEESDRYPENLERIRLAVVREFNIPDGKINSYEEMVAVLNAVVYETGRQITYDTQAIRFIVSLYIEKRSAPPIVEKEAIVPQSPEKVVLAEPAELDLLLQTLVKGPTADVTIPSEVTQVAGNQKGQVADKEAETAEDGAEKQESKVEGTEIPAKAEENKPKLGPSEVLAQEFIRASLESDDNGLHSSALVDLLYLKDDGELTVKQPLNSLVQTIGRAEVIINNTHPGTEIKSEGKSRGDMVYYMDPPLEIAKDVSDNAQVVEVKPASVTEQSPINNELLEDPETPYEDLSAEEWRQRGMYDSKNGGKDGEEEKDEAETGGIDIDHDRVMKSLASWGKVREDALHALVQKVEKEFKCSLREAQVMVARTVENLVENGVVDPNDSWFNTNTQQVRTNLSSPLLGALRLEARGKAADNKRKKSQGSNDTLVK